MNRAGVILTALAGCVLIATQPAGAGARDDIALKTDPVVLAVAGKPSAGLVITVRLTKPAPRPSSGPRVMLKLVGSRQPPEEAAAAGRIERACYSLTTFPAKGTKLARGARKDQRVTVTINLAGRSYRRSVRVQTVKAFAAHAKDDLAMRQLGCVNAKP